MNRHLCCTDMTCSNDCVHPLSSSLLNHGGVHPTPTPSIFVRFSPVNAADEQPAGRAESSLLCAFNSIRSFTLSLLWQFCLLKRRIESERAAQRKIDPYYWEKKARERVRWGLGWWFHVSSSSDQCSAAAKGINHQSQTHWHFIHIGRMVICM